MQMPKLDGNEEARDATVAPPVASDKHRHCLPPLTAPLTVPSLIAPFIAPVILVPGGGFFVVNAPEKTHAPQILLEQT